MVISRMIDKDQDKEYVLVDKADIDALKKETETLKRALNARDSLSKLMESDQKVYKEKLDAYEQNFLCKTILSVSQYTKKWIQSIKDRRNDGKVY